MQGELALDGLQTRLFARTPTKLTTWLDCPFRERFTYLDRPAAERSPLGAQQPRLSGAPRARRVVAPRPVRPHAALFSRSSVVR